MTAISLSPLREYCYYLVRSSNIRACKRRQDEEGKQSDKAAIRDLVLTFWPTIRSVQQRKLKLLMLVLYDLQNYKHQTKLLSTNWKTYSHVENPGPSE